LTAEEAREPAQSVGETRAAPPRLIVRLGWFVGLWLLGAAALGGVAGAIHWALAAK